MRGSLNVRVPPAQAERLSVTAVSEGNVFRAIFLWRKASKLIERAE